MVGLRNINTEVPDWHPLIKWATPVHAADMTASELSEYIALFWMWMYRDDAGVNWYKNVQTRKYLGLDTDGRVVMYNPQVS